VTHHQAANHGLCTTLTEGGARFSATTGEVTGGGAVSAHSCTSSNTTTSYAYYQAQMKIVLPAFTGQHGAFNMSVKWTLTFGFHLSMKGSTCGHTGQLDDASAAVVVALVNDSDGKVLASKVKSYADGLKGAGSNVTTVDLNLTLKVAVHLDGSDSYSVATGFGFDMQTEVDNPTVGHTASCTADASGVGLGGSSNTLAQLDEAKLA
jgi:hypothetical protein